MTSRFKRILLTVLVLLTSIASEISMAEVVVIVHPSNGAILDQKAISKIFLGKSSLFPGGGDALPVNIKEGSSITDEFNEKVLNKNGAQLKSYWSKLVFTGKGAPPKEVESEEAVLELVKSNPAVIGFVSSKLVVDDVKVVLEF